jgi:hypothetical protein
VPFSFESTSNVRPKSIIRSRIPPRPTPTELAFPYVPIVPMSVKTPVVASMLYIETSFDPEFVT